MKKIKMNYMITLIFTLTVICVILGVMFNQTEAEKVNGLAAVFDISADGIIAYVSHNQGKPGIYIRTDEKDTLALELSEEESISDIAFSPNDRTIAYIVNDAEVTRIHTMDIRSFDTKELLHDEAYITEVVYNPENKEELFFLKAATFENYSPIARAHPHEFDVYSYDNASDKTIKHTDLATYDMGSLSVEEDGKTVYVTMVDDSEIETAEDSFSAGKKIFRIPLDRPKEKTTLNMPAKDVYDLAILPNGEGIIYQAVNKTGEDGIFQYELFYYNASTHDTERITNVHSHASRPVLGKDQETVYFIVNSNFAGKHANNELYRVNIDGNEEAPVPLEHE